MVMHFALLVLLLISTLHASAQCCCSDIRLSVSVAGGNERDFVMVRDPYLVRLHDRDSTDQLLYVELDAGCGVAERKVIITRSSTNEVMELHVLFVGYDGVHPGLRVAFHPGKYEVDYTRLRACAGDSRYEDLVRNDSASTAGRIVPCGSCQVRVERDKDGITLDPLHLREGGCGPGRVELGGIGQAYCPEGQMAFQAGAQVLLDRKVSLRANGSVMYTGIACITERGNFHGRIAHERTDRVYNMELALMKGPLWAPAWVADTEALGGRQAIDSIVRFTLVSGTGIGR